MVPYQILPDPQGPENYLQACHGDVASLGGKKFATRWFSWFLSLQLYNFGLEYGTEYEGVSDIPL